MSRLNGLAILSVHKDKHVNIGLFIVTRNKKNVIRGLVHLNV